MKSISSWAASLEDKILGALWSLLQNMLIPIMSGLSVFFRPSAVIKVATR